MTSDRPRPLSHSSNASPASPGACRHTTSSFQNFIVTGAPTPPLSSPNPWRRLLDRSFDDSEQAMEFAERYARDWATGMTQMNG